MKATILLITYNHERFVAQAIESVLEQRCDFRFELIISEDCSTDGTRAIARSFAERHPDRISLLLSPHNLNDNSVLTRGIEAARGQYLALLDGDDYWTSQDKLQRQVDFLDARPDCSICFHNVQVVYDDGALRDHPFHLARPTLDVSAPVPKPTSQLADLVSGNFIQTCSVVLRAAALPAIPPWYIGLAIGDWPLYVLCAEHGDIGYLEEVLAAYRVHDAGLWSSRLSHNRSVADVRALLDTFDVVDEHLGGRYRHAMRPGTAYLHRAGILAALRERSYGAALRHVPDYALSAGLGEAARDRALVREGLRALARGMRPAKS